MKQIYQSNIKAYSIFTRMLGLIIITILAVLSWIFLDTPISQFFSEFQTLKPIASWLTLLGNATPWVAISLIGIYIGHYSSKYHVYKAKFIAMLLSIAGSGLIIAIIKLSIGRFRPKEWIHNNLYQINPFSLSYWNCSFPSGHSQTIFAAMISLALIYPSLRWVFVTIAIIVASTRVVLTSHFLSDVIIGSYIGYIIPMLIYTYFLPTYKQSQNSKQKITNKAC